jgi:hypothetical protein
MANARFFVVIHACVAFFFFSVEVWISSLGLGSALRPFGS